MAISFPFARWRRRGRRPVERGDDGLVKMSLRDHLAELRRRLMISIVAIGVGAVAAFIVYNRLLDFLTEPYCDLKRDKLGPQASCDLIITDPLDGVTTRFKVAAYLGLVLALPIVLYQLWRFITPGLHPKERKYAIPFIICSLILFGLGSVIAVLTFPNALSFLVSVSGSNVEALFTPGKYISLYTLIMLAFGLAFEFPVVLVFLQLVRVLSPRKLMKAWRGATIGIFAFAAVITPSQDPYSMLGMALPMVLFYFLAAGIGKLLGR